MPEGQPSSSESSDITKNVLVRRLAEAAGWYGALAILAAYALTSFGIVAPNSALFQLLNLTGALGVMVVSLYKRVVQSVVLNVFWAGVAIIALLQLALK